MTMLKGRSMKGPKGKFTKERAQIICDSIRNGLSKEAACARAGIDRKTFYNWLTEGRAAKRGRYADFYQAFRDAEAQFEALATRAVRDGMMGGFFQVPMFDADRKLIPQVDPETGEQLRDSQGRPQFKMESSYREPDPALALKVLARRNPRDWGNAPQPSIDEELDQVEAEQKARQNPPDHRKIGIPLVIQAMRLLIGSGSKDWIPDDAKETLLADYLKQRGLKAVPAGSVEASAIAPEGNGVPALPPATGTDNDRRD